jgi:ribosomal protein S18 acetylase RimI-like enzyme
MKEKKDKKYNVREAVFSHANIDVSPGIINNAEESKDFYIKPLEYRDLNVISELHIDYLPTILIKSDYSIKLLNLYYYAIMCDKSNIYLGVYTNNNLIGYIIFIKHYKDIYKKLINFYFQIIINIIKQLIIQPSYIKIIIRRIGEIISIRDNVSNYRELIYELKAIVVRKDYQEKNLASQLLSKGEAELKKRGEKKYFLGVLKSNFRAINFYNKANFRIVDFLKEKTLIMEKDIP